jgi:hypothetical protein
MQRSGFYNLQSARRAMYPTKSTVSLKPTLCRQVATMALKEPKSDAKINLGETGRASTAWRSDSSTIGIEESFGQT